MKTFTKIKAQITEKYIVFFLGINHNESIDLEKMIGLLRTDWILVLMDN